MLDIKYINELLKEGKSVKDIRTILGVGEKLYQKQIRELNYKYNQKTRQYEPVSEVLSNSMINYSSNNNIYVWNHFISYHENKGYITLEFI